MEYDQRVIIRFLCKERIASEDIHVHLEPQFGDATDSERSVRRWCKHARQGREDLHDEMQSGRPPMDFLDIRILALLDEQPFTQLIRLLKLGCFPLNYLESFAGIA
jgi:hypothetical protein